MEEIKLKGIVIKADDYKDSDKLVTIFSAEKGLIRARARGVKKNKAKLAFAVQPFAFIEFMLSERNGFYTVINATSIDQFFGLTADFDNYLFMLSCLEVLEKTVRENQVQPELFVLMLNSPTDLRLQK
jgi:DNA repair protein RecO (recombination protein O)